MSAFFLDIVNMSISASWALLAVLLLRLLLKKAPKWITVLLWGIVAVRLICPFTIESVMSLIPSAETINPNIMTDKTPEINTGIPILNNAINPAISSSFSPVPGDSANPLQVWIPVLSLIWIAGIVLSLAYTTISYWRVKRRIGTAVLFRDNIYQSETVISPFVLGIIKPKIYLSFHMSKQDMEHVIAHEQAHIRRKDHWWKPFGFLLLSLHWFNPFIWLGYVLLCRDIEFACDEKVVKGMNTEQRADYSQALLAFSVNRHMIAACPLAFGEVNVKNRVKSVLNYKKPAFWIIIVAIIASITVAVCFLTNPKTPKHESEIVPDTAGIYTDYDGIDDSTNAIPSGDVDQLETKFPMYFDLTTTKGLEVYIWQLAEGSYSCGLLAGKNALYTQEELWNLHKSPASIEEMRAIIAYYISNGKVTKDDVTIHAIQMPFSSYAYTIDDAYYQRLNDLFWKGTTNILTETRDEWGIKMDVLFKSATEFDIIIEREISAGINATYTISPAYEIRAYVENGETISLEDYMHLFGEKDYQVPDIEWDDVLYTLEPGDKLILNENLKVTYGDLPAGSYVLIKTVTETIDGVQKNYLLMAQFAVVD